MNLFSHFPLNVVAPDIGEYFNLWLKRYFVCYLHYPGPKMYISQASPATKNTKGSTRLHMDMADAVNIMLHTELQPDGTPGCAVWDLFAAEDSEKISRFLKRKLRGNSADPIHSQKTYLNDQLRKQLFEEEGVRSWRVYQRAGDAVFIPAGCAHQVCSSFSRYV